MPVMKNLGKEKQIERRKRKIDNLLSSTSNAQFLSHFNYLKSNWETKNSYVFTHSVNQFYSNFRKNLFFIQDISGMNQKEFSALTQVSCNVFYIEEKAYKLGLPLHTFLKIYTTFLLYIDIDFCDMFTLDFSQTFPFLAEKREENRQKLGKKPRKKA